MSFVPFFVFFVASITTPKNGYFLCYDFFRSRNALRMADILRQFETMAAIASAIKPIKNVGIAMSTIQSLPIDTATRQHNWLFAIYLVILLVAAALTYLVWRSGNRVQDLARKEADVRIAESNAEAKRAGESAAQANERAELLKHENLQIRTALANVQTELANARRRQSEAEKETLRLRERIRPRNLEPAQREKLLNRLRDSPTKGAVLMHFQLGDGEAAEFALQLREVLEEAGWQPSPVSAIPYVRMYDLHVWTQNDLRPPHHANMLRGALLEADLPVRETTYSAMRDGDVALVVGFKSLYR